jgi:predicted MFS family arabinose efflux permease
VRGSRPSSEDGPGPEGARQAGTLAAGVLAAACLGSIAPVSALIRNAFRLSPLTLGVTISLITLVTAAAAIPAGAWLRSRDPRPWLTVGLAVMAVAGAAMTLAAPSQPALIGLRAVEGIGYLLIVVGGPAALAGGASSARSTVALALWGACTPAGLAVGALAGGYAASTIGWRAWFAALAVACAALAGMLLLAGGQEHRPAQAPGRRIRPRAEVAAALWLASGFAALSLMTVAIVSVLPAYLSGRGLAQATAGAATAVVAAASLPGNACAAVLLRRGVPPGPLTCSMVLCPVLAAVAFSGAVPRSACIAAAAALVFAVGIAASAAYVSLPRIVGVAEDLPFANGILMQFGSAGALIGPPIFAAVTGLRHWDAVGYLVAPAAIISAAAMARATMRRPEAERVA